MLPILSSIIRVIVNPLIAVLMGVAIVVFIWGVVEYVWKADTEEGRSKGARAILWGLVGLFIMVSVFSIMRFIANTIQVQLHVIR